MASWASNRRIIYLSLIAGFFILIFAYPIFSLVYEAPSCFDTAQNQNETGIDCGGVCDAVCEFETVSPVILWSRVLRVEGGVYDTIARIENQNVTGGASRVPYSFKLYDENGVLIAERLGSTFVNPSEQFTVFEGAIKTGKRVPIRVFFEFLENPKWVKIKEAAPVLSIQNQTFTDDGVKPRLRAEISNNTFDTIERIILTAVVFDLEDNAIAASKTEVDRLLPQSSKTISFIWPQTFGDVPTRIEIIPRVNIVEK
ncbi:MAG: hypothetical protein Q8R36_04000 [bacterium]|nr:hypothetical protein [bacterium]